MISLSTAAHEQIRLSATTGDLQSVPLRVAVKQLDDGSLHYAMGFDEHKLPGDTFFNFDGVDLVVSTGSKGLADGMTIDYVELEPGKLEFIFLNPNDPAYVPPSA
jgi:Fe-S cluster assembly iron-binding protein IscA